MADHLTYPHTEISFHHHYLSARDHAIVDNHIHGFGNGAVQFNNGPGGEFNDVFQWKLGPPEQKCLTGSSTSSSTSIALGFFSTPGTDFAGETNPPGRIGLGSAIG